MTILLDTHFWIWWLTPESPLSARERTALDEAAGQRRLAISPISMWEAQVLHLKGRLELPLRFSEWLAIATDPRAVSIVALDPAVIVAMDGLPESFHGDPADRLIVATARAHALSLATRDKAIRRSRLVRLWKP